MGKNNRQRRAKKQAQKKKRQKDRRRNPKKQMTIAPNFYQINNPFAQLSEEQRKEAINAIASNSEKILKESLEKLNSIFLKNNPLLLLSVLANYGLTAPVGDQGVLTKDSDQDIFQSHVEICQALFLQTKEDEIGWVPFKSEEFEEAYETLKDLLTAHQFLSLNEIKEDATNDEKAIELIQQLVRGNTKMVRNWGFHNQVVQISKELYRYFDPVLEKAYGFSATQIIELFLHFIDEIEKRSTERMNVLSELYSIKNKTELVYRYYQLSDLPKEEANSFIENIPIEKIDVKNLFLMLNSHYDLFIPDIYTFNAENTSEYIDISNETIKRILDEFSYSFGDLEEVNTEHLFLSNPIWTRPVIKINDYDYFCPLPQVFFSFVMPSLERLIEKIDHETISGRRSEYLEGKIEEIINRRFSESNTVVNLKWALNGVEYETDLVTFIDSHAIIVEAKSGKISESALRGAPGRLKRNINDILVDPNIQSKRLEDRLRELINNPNLDDDLRSKLPVDLKDINKIVRVSVALEDFAMLQANISKLKETGWLPDDIKNCPTMNLADFETLFDFLEHPVQIIHYLTRRQEMEGVVNYFGDELDFMGLYIDTLFCHGDVDSSVQFSISGFSDPIDAYYKSKDAGIEIPKPKPKSSQLFTKIFQQLERGEKARWTEAGVILNRFSPDEQRQIEKRIERLRKNVIKNWSVEGHENVLVFTPPKASEYALCYLVYNNRNMGQRYEYFENAASHGLQPEHVKTCLVIGENMDDELAYSLLGLSH